MLKPLDFLAVTANIVYLIGIVCYLKFIEVNLADPLCCGGGQPSCKPATSKKAIQL